MNTTVPERSHRLVLDLGTAEELMTPCPVTVAASATLREAIGIMVDRGISALPVVDENARLVGVLSQTDIVIHDRNLYSHTLPEYYTTANLLSGGTRLLAKFSVDSQDTTHVHAVMTPTVFAVRPDDPPTRVVAEMVAFKIHRLFVIDGNGSLMGVISAYDVLRKLRSESCTEDVLTRGPQVA